VKKLELTDHQHGLLRVLLDMQRENLNDIIDAVDEVGVQDLGEWDFRNPFQIVEGEA
jgi:hypothetical protein